MNIKETAERIARDALAAGRSQGTVIDAIFEEFQSGQGRAEALKYAMTEYNAPRPSAPIPPPSADEILKAEAERIAGAALASGDSEVMLEACIANIFTGNDRAMVRARALELYRDRERCQRCKFSASSGTRYLECRRYPPIPDKPGHFTHAVSGPAVNPADWCGEYQPKTGGE